MAQHYFKDALLCDEEHAAVLL